jgi:hypothetical protein
MDSKSSAPGDFDPVDTYDMCKIVKGSWAFNGVASTAALLLPLMAVAESHLQSGTGAAFVATAHVNFKIVIPKVLSLQVGDSGPLAIMSNGRTVAHAVCASAGAGPILCTASLP